MKTFKVVVLVSLFLIISAHVCQANQITDAIKALQKAYPNFNWQKNTAVVVDINADGINDVAVLGYTDDKAAVGVVLGGPSKSFHTKILDFNRGRDIQRGMCGKTAKLIVDKTSETPKEALGEFPEGYRICDKCFEISVDDGLCDPMTIFWNYKTNELGWWRA
jgi:hypothetical protein